MIASLIIGLKGVLTVNIKSLIKLAIRHHQPHIGKRALLGGKNVNCRFMPFFVVESTLIFDEKL